MEMASWRSDCVPTLARLPVQNLFGTETIINKDLTVKDPANYAMEKYRRSHGLEIIKLYSAVSS